MSVLSFWKYVCSLCCTVALSDCLTKWANIRLFIISVFDSRANSIGQDDFSVQSSALMWYKNQENWFRTIEMRACSFRINSTMKMFSSRFSYLTSSIWALHVLSLLCDQITDICIKCQNYTCSLVSLDQIHQFVWRIMNFQHLHNSSFLYSIVDCRYGKQQDVTRM